MTTALSQVMLIDDDPLTILLFDKINRIVGFAQEVISFYNAVDALDYLQRTKTDRPDVIFLDICMPIVNGWQFLEQFKTLSESSVSSPTIFMLATSADQSDMNRAKKFDSVADYIVKPLTVERLRAVQRQLSGAVLT